MKYAADIPLIDVGDDWAGHLDVQGIYDWDSATIRSGGVVAAGRT